MKRQKNIITLLFGLIAITLSAQQYQSAHIERAAKKLAIDTMLLKPGTNRITVDRRQLTVRVNESGTIEHIGIPLFSQQMRTLQPSPIYDYLENAVLEHALSITSNIVREKNLQFLSGNWQTLEQLSDTLACTITNLSDKAYVVSWLREGQETAKVSFPISYDLLANSTRREMEENFVRDLRNFKPQPASPADFAALPLLSTDSVKPGIYPTVCQEYIIPSITDCLYVQVDKDGDRHLIRDNRYVAESMANLLLSPQPKDASAEMELSVRKSDYHTDTLTTTPHALLSFCQTQGCKPYFGFEGIHGGMASATLILSNKASGYDHILHVTCQTSDIGSETLMLKATAFLFTPTHNLKSLFGSLTDSKNSKSIIIWK